MTVTAPTARRPWGPPRTDIPAAEFPAATKYAIITEWLGRVAVVAAVILFALVMTAIHKGLQVQHTADSVVDNFITTNRYFDERADLTAPATAREQLQQLQTILTDLNTVAATDVEHLGLLLPDATALVAAGQGDNQIAQQLQTVAVTLQGAAASIHQVAATADTTVGQVSTQLNTALELVRKLNAELTRTTDKLAPIPAQDGLIPPPAPAPGEN